MVRNIHLIFKTHLDVGFTDYASVVVNNYFSNYIPASLRVAREMRESGQAGTLHLDDRLMVDLRIP